MSKAPPPSYNDAVGKGLGPSSLSSSVASSSSTSSQRRARVASLTLRGEDMLMIIDFPPEVFQLLRKLITAEWNQGIQKFFDYGEASAEYKLKGSPWWAVKWDAIAGARLLMRIFSALSAEGWSLAVSTRMARQQENTDTLFFKQTPPLQRSFFAISFPSGDHIRIIDAPEDAHDKFVRAFSGWCNGVQKSEAITPRVHEFKLRGNPFENRLKDIVNIRFMMHFLLEGLDDLGYELFASIGMDRGYGGNSHDEMRSVDTWFLTQRDAV